MFEPSERLWGVWGLILNVISPLLLSFWGFSALGHEVSPHSCSKFDHTRGIFLGYERDKQWKFGFVGKISWFRKLSKNSSLKEWLCVAASIWTCLVTNVNLSSVQCAQSCPKFPLSMGFSRQECWNGLPCPPPGDLPDPGIEPVSPLLADWFFTTESPGESFSKMSHIALRFFSF